MIDIWSSAPLGKLLISNSVDVYVNCIHVPWIDPS